MSELQALEDGVLPEIEALDESLNRIINAANSFLGKVRHYSEDSAATPAEAHLVTVIHNHPEANAHQLARILGFTKGNVSLRTAKLCEKGLIERFNKGNNRKEIFYRLTPGGQALFDAHARFHAEQHREIYRKFQSFPQREKDFICGFLKEFADYLEDFYFRENQGRGGDSHG